MSATFQQARLSRDKRFDGQFFVAVKTTGIFCRPICPARLPKESNVRYFQHAEQAMAHGFRPCLRCRPESAPGSWAWQGTQTTVQRAITLLQSEPQLTVQELAARLGITDRYLRQLFKQQVGMGVKQLQSHQRLLQAKCLLANSNLSIEQIAQVVGFASARGLQQGIQTQWGLSPRQLRSKVLSTPNQLRVFLACSQPYPWPQVRDFLAARALTNVEQVSAHSYQRRLGHGGQVCATYSAEKGGFDLVFTRVSVEQVWPLLSNLKRVLDTDAPAALISNSLTHAGLSEEHQLIGIRIPGAWSAFEAGCRAILGQQVSLKAAVTLVNQLITLTGTECFPSASDVANLAMSQLGMPERRRQALNAFARYVADHPDWQADDILAIKGIGPWTVNYIKLRGLSHPDIWLANDLIVKRQVNALSIDAAQASPWRSYLGIQLWHLS